MTWTPPHILDDGNSVYAELLDLITRRPDWHHQAACHGQTATMYPDGTGGYQAAHQLCRSCPVRTPCAEAAIDNEEGYGTWGGLSENERRRIIVRKRRTRPAA